MLQTGVELTAKQVVKIEKLNYSYSLVSPARYDCYKLLLSEKVDYVAMVWYYLEINKNIRTNKLEANINEQYSR